MLSLTQQEQDGIERAKNFLRIYGYEGIIYADVASSREDAEVLLSLHGKLEEAERARAWIKAEKDGEQQRAERLFNENSTLRTELAEARKQLEIARKAFVKWRDDPSDFADYKLRRALSQITPTETKS
jgi:hypothetical protein